MQNKSFSVQAPCVKNWHFKHQVTGEEPGYNPFLIPPGCSGGETPPDLFLIQFVTEACWEMYPDGRLEAWWHLKDQMREHFILGLQKAHSG